MPTVVDSAFLEPARVNGDTIDPVAGSWYIEHLNDEVERAYEVLRAIYLTRRYGTDDRADPALSLSKLVEIVERNLDGTAAAHARTLIVG